MKAVKFLAIAAIAALAFTLQAASLSDARKRISEAIDDPEVMGELMASLSAEDQITFLADVNTAIESMPGSNEEKTAKFLNINRAAVRSAKPGNLVNVLAEVYATVPVESLTLINERFAADLFNRAADPSVTYSDEQFTAIAKSVTEKIQARNTGSDDAAVRNTFGVLTFVRASNGSPADLVSTLTESFDEADRNRARNEWMPPALETPANYEPLLGGAEDAGEQPNIPTSIRIAGPQLLEAMLSDIVDSTNASVGNMPTDFTDAANAVYSNPQLFTDVNIERIPFTPGWVAVDAAGNIHRVKWDRTGNRDAATKPGTGTGGGTIIEPGGYPNQTIGY